MRSGVHSRVKMRPNDSIGRLSKILKPKEKLQTRLRFLDKEKSLVLLKDSRASKINASARENRMTRDKAERKVSCGGKREIRKRKVLACFKDYSDLFSVIICK